MCYITPNRLMDQVSFPIGFACVYSDIHNTPGHLPYSLHTATPPPPPVKNSEKGRPHTGYWLKVIRYCVIPLQVPLLFVFTQHFHFENTLRLQTALPRTFVHEHCSTTFTQTLHWWMTWKLFWSFNDSRSQRCCDTGCRGTPIAKANWLTWCNSCCGIFFTIAMGNLSEK